MTTTQNTAANYLPASIGILTVDGGLMVHTRTLGEDIKAGDLIRPISDQYPVTVASIRHARGWWKIVGEHGVEWKFRDTDTIPTATHIR